MESGEKQGDDLVISSEGNSTKFRDHETFDQNIYPKYCI